MDLFHKLTINAARRLPNLPGNHICSRLHGHTFLVEIHLAGDVDAHSGWVIDFSEFDEAAADIKSVLEHRYLNDVAGLENPTSENLAIWIWQRVASRLPGLTKIVVMEGADRGCAYRGPNM